MGLSDQPKESRFLYAEDLLRDGVWREYTLTVKEAIEPGILKAADKKPIMQTTLAFEKSGKMLPLNTTNHRLLKLHFGTEKREKWVGKKVTVYPALINCFGEQNVPCIRFRLGSDRPIPFSVRKHLGRDITGVKLQTEENGE